MCGRRWARERRRRGWVQELDANIYSVELSIICHSVKMLSCHIYDGVGVDILTALNCVLGTMALIFLIKKMLK